MDNVAGIANGERRYEDASGNPRISSKDTILVNEWTNGYFGLYKRPLVNMGILDNRDRLRGRLLDSELREEIRELYCDCGYDAIKNAFISLLDKSEKKGKGNTANNREDNGIEVDFVAFYEKVGEKLVEATCGDLPEKQKAYFKKMLHVEDDSVMAKLYKKLTDSSDQYSFGNELLNEMFRDPGNDWDEEKKCIMRDIVITEEFLRCIEVAFYQMMNSADIENAAIKDEDADKYKDRYESFVKLESIPAEGLVKERIDALKGCNPNENDFYEKIVDYHLYVCKSRNKAPWLERNDKRITVNVNIDKESVDWDDIDKWNRNYYLFALRNIAIELEG